MQPAEPASGTTPIVETGEAPWAASVPAALGDNSPESESAEAVPSMLIDEPDGAAEGEAVEEDPAAAEQAGPPVTGEQARAMIERLEQLEEKLGAVEGNEEARAPLLDGATKTLEAASDVLDRVPKDDPTFEVLRDELLDAYFALDRQVHPSEEPARPAPTTTPRRPRPPAKGKKKTKKITQAVRRPRSLTEQVELRRGRIRTTVMMIVLVLLAGGRVAYYFLVENAAPKGAPVVGDVDVAGVKATRVKKGNSLQEDAAQGVPVVTFLILRESRDGSLRASAAAVDLNSSQVKLTFKWFKNDKLHKVEHDGYLAPDEVEAFAKYRVEVTAGDGRLTSRPLRSQTISRGGDGPGQAKNKGGK